MIDENEKPPAWGGAEEESRKQFLGSMHREKKKPVFLLRNKVHYQNVTQSPPTPSRSLGLTIWERAMSLYATCVVTVDVQTLNPPSQSISRPRMLIGQV